MSGDICVMVKDNFIETIDNAKSVAILIGVDVSLDALKPWFESNSYGYKLVELKERIARRVQEMSQ
jgi:hypothetical protein